MAKRQTSENPRATNLQVIGLLSEAAKTDTVYQDLYLQRAAERLSSLLSKAEYEQLKVQNATIDNLLAQARHAVDRQDWTKVQQLTGRATGFRRLLDEKRGEMALAEAIYEEADVAVDPFSPGFGALLAAGGSTTALRDELVATLTSLAKDDPEWGDLYAQRRIYFTELSLSPELRIQQVAGETGSQLQQQMQQAAEKGDLEQLNRLAGEMLKTSTPTKSDPSASGSRQAPALRRSAALVTLAQPFPASALEPARALGLAYVEVKPQIPTLRKPLAEFLDWYAWHPSFPAQELAREGSSHLRPLLKEALKDFPEATELTDPIVEVAALFSIHPYMNGGGARYFPVSADSEFVLVEDFPEQEEAANSALLSALGLSQRRGLSRQEIETALRQHGGQLLQDRLDLDPREFRLVCIPFDVYMRVGRDQGWGQRRQWTHFDGYQVRQGGRLRALVGGDVHYGGLLDLVSINPDAQNERVVARFAIVRRERFMAR